MEDHNVKGAWDHLTMSYFNNLDNEFLDKYEKNLMNMFVNLKIDGGSYFI
jgi:hypothetical protein